MTLYYGLNRVSFIYKTVHNSGLIHNTYKCKIIRYNFLLQFQSWYRYYGSGREPDVILTIWSLLIVMFALGLAIGVVLAVGALLYFQVTIANHVYWLKKFNNIA